MVQIVLILPGSTDYDLEKRIQGNLEVPLNEQGIAEVGRMVEELRSRKLPIEAVYTANCQHAEQTAQAVAEGLDLRLRKLERMQNLNQGLWQGMLIDDVRVKQPKVYRQWQEHPEYVCAPEGEMFGEALDRVDSTMCKLAKRHRDEMIAVVAPEPLASLVRRFVTQGELGDLWKAMGDHGRWELVVARPPELVQSSSG
jgi:broad specificity phosphatase PhoE